VVTRAAWLRQLQEHPDRPHGRQRRQLDALLALADQLDAETGEGAASILDVAKAAGTTSERTTRRAIGWATASGLLRRTARGHRLGDGTTAPSGWLLLGKPAQPVNSATEPANPAPQAASSRPQPVSSSKVPSTAAKRPGRKVTKAEMKVEIAEFRKWAAKQPPCPDGMPGGDLIGPDGVAPCPLCRQGTSPESATTTRRTP
jgi:hypothetical protein